MPVNKVIFNDDLLIDLTSDTVTAATLASGVTAHDKTGAQIVGTLEASSGGSQDIGSILNSGLTDGYTTISPDGTIIQTVNNEGQKLIKKFSEDFLVCTTTLYDKDENVLGETVKTFSEEGSMVITTVDSEGKKLVKTFSNDLSEMTAVLTGPDGGELARMVKKFSEDGRTISSVVSYNGDPIPES